MAVNQTQQPLLLNPQGTADPTKSPSPYDEAISGVTNHDVPITKSTVPPGDETPDMRERRLLQAATIRSAGDGTLIIDNYNTLSKTPGTGAAALSQAADQWNMDIRGAMNKIIEDNFANIPNPYAYAEEARQQKVVEDAVNARQSKGQRANMEANGLNAPYDQRAQMMARWQMIDMAEEILKDHTFLDGVGDFAVDLIPGKVSVDDWQVMGFHLNPWTSAEEYRKLATKVQALPPDEAIGVFKEMKDIWLDKLPAPRATQMLLGLVDPTQTEDAADSLGIGGAVTNVLDIAMLWGAIGALRKIYNPISTLSKLGNKKAAADINLGVMEGQYQEGRAAQTDRLIANTNAQPFQTAEVLPGVTEDISPALLERLYQFRDKINEAYGSLSDEGGFVKEGLLGEADKAKALRRIDDEFQQWAGEMNKGENKIIKLNGKKETHRGVEFEFEVTDAYGNVSKGKTMMPFKREDVTFWQNLPDNTVSSIFGSQKWQAHNTDYIDSVNAAIRLDTTSASIATQFRKIVKEATKSIRETRGAKSRKDRLKDVDAILILGDKKQKVFSARELNMGVDGIKLDEAQIEAYWKLRASFDSLGVLRNQEVFNDLYARGAKQINFGHDLFRFGEVKHTVEDAKSLLRDNKDVRTVWLHEGRDKGKAINTAGLDLDKAYQEGYRLIRLEDDVMRKSGVFKHILTKVDGVTDGAKTIDDLPHIVVDLKKGYVPRLNKSATWFVQAIQDGFVDGQLSKASRRKAVRSFDNEADAHDWAKRMYEDPHSAGFDGDTHFIAVKDGELEAFRAGDSQLGATKGLITGHRASTPIPHGYPGEFDLDNIRVGAFEALELYLESTKNFMSRNAWRSGMRLKWENTASRMLGGLKVKFDDPGAALSNSKLAQMHEKIVEWSGFRNKSERGFEEMMRKTYEFALRVPGVGGRNKLTKFIFDMKDKDPLGALRASAFHALLGTYNPAQLWVQAQGMMVAAAVNLAHPLTGGWKRLITSVTKQSGLAFMQHGGTLPDSALKVVAKANGFKNVQEMKDMKTIWDRTGYYDSTLTSADVEMAARGYPITHSAFRQFFESGLMFFRAGELFNRRYSFITAVDELGGASEVLKSEDTLKAAMDRANNMMLSLGRANRASWQSGMVSPMTQFMQIQAKTLETIAGVGTELSGKERISLFLTQGMLYGPAGMFAGRYVTKYALDSAGVDQIDINNWAPEKVAMANGGLTDYTLAVLGIDGSASDRSALFNGMDQSVVNLWTKDNTLAEWLLGPSGVPPKRVWQAWALASPVSWAPKPTDGAVDATAQDITDALTYFATDVGEMIVAPFSTASQISRFWLMQDMGLLKDTQGNTIAAPEGGYNPQTEWAALMGVKPNDLQKKFDLADMNKAYEDAVNLRVNMLLRNFDEYMMQVDQHLDTATPFEVDAQRRFRKRWHITVDSIQDEGLREKVRERWSEALERRLTGDSQLDRQIQTYYRNMVQDLVGAHTSTGTRIVQTRENDNGAE